MAPTPHDALFKAIFSQPEHAAAALREVLPAALAARIDFASLSPCSGSFIDEALAASHSDLLFSARIEGAPLFVYVLFEHQSTTHPLMAFRTALGRRSLWCLRHARRPEQGRTPRRRS